MLQFGGAELADGNGRQRIFVVEPTGELEDDLNLTDKKFLDNPIKSYRTKQPLKIVAEVIGWKGYSPEVLNIFYFYLYWKTLLVFL